MTLTWECGNSNYLLAFSKWQPNSFKRVNSLKVHGLLMENVCSPSGSDHHNMNIMENEHRLLEILQTHSKGINTLTAG